MYRAICKGIVILSILFLFTLPCRSDLVGYWSFNGSDSIIEDTAIDTSGEGNNGTITGAVAVAGKIGQALSFDGTNDYVNCGKDLSLSFTGNYTLSAWIKPATIVGSKIIMDKEGTNNGYFLYQSNDEIYAGFGNGSTIRTVTTTTANLVVGNWYYVVSTWDSTYIRIYINGQLSKTSSDFSGDNPVENTRNFYIGTYHGLAMCFNGVIDESRAYNEALSPATILEHYQLGRNVKMTPSASGKIKMTPSASGKLKFGEE